MLQSKLKLPAPELPLGLPAYARYGQSMKAQNRSRFFLGRALFFEKHLSRDLKISCASCHIPNRAYSDGKAVSEGVFGRRGTRNSPTLLNAAYQQSFLWDGRAPRMVAQIKLALSNQREMSADKKYIESNVVLRRKYQCAFRAIYGSDMSMALVADAIAYFTKWLVSGNSDFDQYLYGGDVHAISESAKTGFQLFIGKARCVICHVIRHPNNHPLGGQSALFTDFRFHNIGIGIGIGDNRKDPGRFAVTHSMDDMGKFKTPSLRNVDRTPPYMHDGSLKTLFEVVDFYNKGGKFNTNLDPALIPLRLSKREKFQLVAFLETLNGRCTKLMLQAGLCVKGRSGNTKGIGYDKQGRKKSR